MNKDEKKMVATVPVKAVLFIVWLVSFFIGGWKLNVAMLFLITQIYIGELRKSQGNKLGDLLSELKKP